MTGERISIHELLGDHEELTPWPPEKVATGKEEDRKRNADARTVGEYSHHLEPAREWHVQGSPANGKGLWRILLILLSLLPVILIISRVGMEVWIPKIDSSGSQAVALFEPFGTAFDGRLECFGERLGAGRCGHLLLAVLARNIAALFLGTWRRLFLVNVGRVLFGSVCVWGRLWCLALVVSSHIVRVILALVFALALLVRRLPRAWGSVGVLHVVKH